MHFEHDFSHVDMDDTFRMCAPAPLTCPSATTSFSSASSAYDPFTPTSRRSTPNELSFELESQGSDMATPSTARYTFGPVKSEPVHMHSFTDSLPTTPLKNLTGLSPEYDPLMGLKIDTQGHLGAMTGVNSFGMYNLAADGGMGPYMMTPTHSLSGSEAAESAALWPGVNDSPIAFMPQRAMLASHHELPSHHEIPSQRPCSQSPMDRFSFPEGMRTVPTPESLRFQRKVNFDEIQRRSTELQRASIRAARKRAKRVGIHNEGEIVPRAENPCNYPGCNKVFRRKEHLKRHKQTTHSEGINRFNCEFCGKDQFNRQDNLNNHRKLHARPNNRNRGVEFIPQAVPIIEAEERSRKKRAPPKSKVHEFTVKDYDVSDFHP